MRSPAVHSPQGRYPSGAEYFAKSSHADSAFGRLLSGAPGYSTPLLPAAIYPQRSKNLPQAALNALPIPANYYEDLLARFGGESQVETLQRLQILYDRDTRGGEFLHLYTRPFAAGRFFFELTERRGGYAQYGAVNAAVRLSAMQYS